MPPIWPKRFRVLKLFNLEIFRALKLSDFESFRALKAINLATGTTSHEECSPRKPQVLVGLLPIWSKLGYHISYKLFEVGTNLMNMDAFPHNNRFH